MSNPRGVIHEVSHHLSLSIWLSTMDRLLITINEWYPCAEQTWITHKPRILFALYISWSTVKYAWFIGIQMQLHECILCIRLYIYIYILIVYYIYTHYIFSFLRNFGHHAIPKINNMSNMLHPSGVHPQIGCHQEGNCLLLLAWCIQCYHGLRLISKQTRCSSTALQSSRPVKGCLIDTIKIDWSGIATPWTKYS